MLFRFVGAQKYRLIIILSLFAGIAFKIWLIVSEHLPFNSDEAIVALMARHILNGEKPIYFYGQSYMGSLDAFFVAGGFALLGQKVWVIRAVQVLLYLGTMISTGYLARMISQSPLTSVLAITLMAVPNVNLTLYTSVSLGGYGEMLLIGNLILITAIKIADQIQHNKDHHQSRWWLVFGFLTGLGFWVFSLTLVYSVPAFIFLICSLVSNRKGYPGFENSVRIWLGAGVLGIFLGAFPCVLYVTQFGIRDLLIELLGGAIAGVEKLPWISLIGRRIFNTMVLGMSVAVGMRPPWEVSWLALPLAPLALATWAGSTAHAYRQSLSGRTSSVEKNRNLSLLFGVAITLLTGFAFTSFGSDPSGRYFLPISVILVIFTAYWLTSLRDIIGNGIWLVCVLISLYHLWGNLQAINSPPGGLTTQFDAVTRIDHSRDRELIQFLTENGLTRGYTNYWVAYPLAFLSDETLIYVPRLPYHQDFRYTSRDDRYKPYRELVAQAENVAYITTNHPSLDTFLREAFSQRGIDWKEARIGDYQVFYQLTKVVRPEDLGLRHENPGYIASP